MKTDLITWSIVVTAKAPEVILKAFIAYHLDLGVEKIFLFLDDQKEELESLKNLARVEVIYCNKGYWKTKKNGRPNEHRARQRRNANYAKRITTSEWIIHIDIDEFIYLESTNSILDILSLCQTNVLRL